MTSWSNRRSPGAKRRWAAAAAAVAAGLAVAGAGEATGASPGSPGWPAGPSRSVGRPAVEPSMMPRPRPCPFPVPEEAPVKATCSTVVVPLNRARPDGRTVRLAVARLSSTAPSAPARSAPARSAPARSAPARSAPARSAPARSAPAPAADTVPVAFLNGGPGNSTLADVVPVFLTSPILAGRDVVLWDQRGTGASRPRLDCAESEEAEVAVRRSARSDLADARTLIAASRACARRLVASGADLTAFSTDQNAADVDDVRRALGIARWDLLGVSYGTALAQQTMRSHPSGIRRVVLDSVLPPDRGAAADAFTADEQLIRLLTACQRDRACRKMLPDPQAALSRAVARYQARPHVVAIPADPGTGAPGSRVVLTGTDVAGLFAQATGTFQSAGDTDTSTVLRSLPQRLARLDAGDPRGLDELVRLLRAPGGPAPRNARFDQGMSRAVMCHDRRALLSREEGLEIIRRTPRLAWTVQTQSPALYCPDWPSGTAPASFNSPLRSDIPTLVMAGEFDYQTPLDWSRQVAETLPGSRFVAFGTSGHALTATPCGQRVIDSFLASPDAEPRTGCVPALRSTRFDTK
jgi:pimeloyl-ACP methyl ester carboxylesterase